MEFYKNGWKILLVVFAVLIGAMSLWYTNNLMQNLSIEEYKRIMLWAEATQKLINAEPDEDVSFYFEVLRNNQTIPVILVDNNDEIISFRNIDSLKMQNPEYRKKILNEFKNNGNESFIISTEEGVELNRIYYSNSYLLTQLKYYPFIQLGIVTLFILVSYFAFSIARKAEQDKVWLGMSKETAHQLGTPISSLMAAIEILKLQDVEPRLLKEIQKDVDRLEKIAARFSKIGSKAKLEKQNLYQVIDETIKYLTTRFPSGIKIIPEYDNSKSLILPLNRELFEWVLENLCKNSADAIGQSGFIKIKIEENTKEIFIDIEDNGKGIPKSKFKEIFKPGYTTKSRGWGLGLSLVKRIIEQYHYGKVFVRYSEINVGTCFRIILKKHIKNITF
ncbi:MAG: ATP-binding protein [Bacteroidales bacterium]|jgi:signal transduction histidine kinase|nr:ATP-binding protein [Bacteroidales bacterium]HOL98538.1 ATP-binding protein [Bacteroidales bacterium]HOM35697.1 ATP-binding protein [Bacteroidales bacterium]HPD23163.1 ATP-binding protein [Bacteroidales bacterium]HRS99092.1 ATP-binding protein [Bacteroidales bacterium]